MTEPTFFFTSLKVEQQLIVSIQNLNEFSLEQLQSFTELVLSFLSQQVISLFCFLIMQSKDPDQEIKEFSQEHGVGWKACKGIFHAILFFLGHCLKMNLAQQCVRQDLFTFGLEPKRAKYIAEQFGKKFISLSTSMIENTLKVNELVNMEWKFGITAGNDDLKELGKVFLVLKLTINRGERLEDVVMELTLAQFYSLLSELQKAQRNF